VAARLGVPSRDDWPPPYPVASEPLHDEDAPDEEPPPSSLQRKRNEGRNVFRVRSTRAASWAGGGLILGGLVSATSGRALGLLDLGAGNLAEWVLVWTGIAMTSGYAIGRTRRIDYCSDPGCEGPLALEDERCDKCGGRVRGEIARAADRLDAEEALEAGRPLVGKEKRGGRLRLLFKLAMPALILGGILLLLMFLPHRVTVHELRTLGGERKRGTLELRGDVESTSQVLDAITRLSDGKPLSSFALEDDTGTLRIWYDEALVTPPLQKGNTVTVRGSLQADDEAHSYFVAESVRRE
jgi:hypothetical protein